MKLAIIGSRVILVHEIADARAALTVAQALGIAVTLASAPSGAASLGAGWWQAVMRRAVAEHPDARFAAVLDCGARADLAQAALRQGLADVCYRGPAVRARKLADIAGQCGPRLHRPRPRGPHLPGLRHRYGACGTWLPPRGPTGAAVLNRAAPRLFKRRACARAAAKRAFRDSSS